MPALLFTPSLSVTHTHACHLVFYLTRPFFSLSLLSLSLFTPPSGLKTLPEQQQHIYRPFTSRLAPARQLASHDHLLINPAGPYALAWTRLIHAPDRVSVPRQPLYVYSCPIHPPQLGNGYAPPPNQTKPNPHPRDFSDLPATYLYLIFCTTHSASYSLVNPDTVLSFLVHFFLLHQLCLLHCTILQVDSALTRARLTISLAD